MIWPSAQSIVCRSVLRSERFTSGVRAGFQPDAVGVNQYITYEFVIQNWKGYAGGQVSFHMTMTQPEGINSYYCGWFYFLLGTPTKSQNLSQRRNGWCPEIKDFEIGRAHV